ncbi:hypothetical protein EON82_04165 [bacterium]|nr:MAG: hypothetical protein EON82_04165 [bacterium]
MHWIDAFREGRDILFGQPFWLRERVGNEYVWAANWRHFEDLLFFLKGDWRLDRHRYMGSNYSPHWSYRTRYPKWMQQKANRVAILKALERIRKHRLGR